MARRVSNNNPPCRAHSKTTGAACKNKACDGKAVCRMHGGGVNPETGRGSGAPIIHGRYSKIKSPRLQELIAEFGADADPLDLLPELALLRGLITDFVERYDVFSEALIHWHESFYLGEATPKPHRILDLVSASQFIGQIGNIAARIEKTKAEGAITMETMVETVRDYAQAVGASIAETIADDDLRSKLLATIERRTGNIQVGGRRKPIS
jgi:hypothetical protein